MAKTMTGEIEMGYFDEIIQVFICVCAISFILWVAQWILHCRFSSGHISEILKRVENITFFQFVGFSLLILFFICYLRFNSASEEWRTVEKAEITMLILYAVFLGMELFSYISKPKDVKNIFEGKNAIALIVLWFISLFSYTAGKRPDVFEFLFPMPAVMYDNSKVFNTHFWCHTGFVLGMSTVFVFLIGILIIDDLDRIFDIITIVAKELFETADHGFRFRITKIIHHKMIGCNRINSSDCVIWERCKAMFKTLMCFILCWVIASVLMDHCAGIRYLKIVFR